MTILEDKVFKEGIKVKKTLRVRPESNRMVPFRKRKNSPPPPHRSTPTKERLCEKTARRHLFLSQGERLVLPAPGSWPSSLLSYEKKKKILLFKPPTLWYICTYLFFIHYLFVYRAALAHVGKEKFSFYLLGSMAGSKKETDPVSFRN